MSKKTFWPSWESSGSLTLDLSRMEPIGETDADTRLLGTVQINGVSFHVEAIQLKLDEEEVQQAAAAEMHDAFNEIYSGIGAEGPLRTIEHDGKQYAVFIYPYCD